MFRHVVMFRWKASTTSEQLRAIREALAGLPQAIPEIRDYRFGSDLQLAPGNYQFVVVADFDDQAGYEAYRDHPVHQAVRDEHISPAVAERAAVQYDIG